MCIYVIVCFCGSAREVIAKRLHLKALKHKLRKKIGIHSKSLTITFLNEFKSHTLLYQHHTVHTKQSFFICIIDDFTHSTCSVHMHIYI